MMKLFQALSVVEPWGDCVRNERKTLEIRRWAPITWPLRDLLIVQNKKRLSRSGLTSDSDGIALALVDVTHVRGWIEQDLDASASAHWEPGYLAWEMVNIRFISYSRPLPARLWLYSLELDEALIESRGRSA